MEVIQNGRDNYIGRIMKSAGVALTNDDMDALTQITVTVAGVTYTSTNQASDPVRWRQTGYDTGEIRIMLGDKGITPGTYVMEVVLYDAVNVDGLEWESFRVMVTDDVEVP